MPTDTAAKCSHEVNPELVEEIEGDKPVFRERLVLYIKCFDELAPCSQRCSLENQRCLSYALRQLELDPRIEEVRYRYVEHEGKLGLSYVADAEIPMNRLRELRLEQEAVGALRDVLRMRDELSNFRGKMTDDPHCQLCIAARMPDTNVFYNNPLEAFKQVKQRLEAEEIYKPDGCCKRCHGDWVNRLCELRKRFGKTSFVIRAGRAGLLGDDGFDSPNVYSAILKPTVSEVHGTELARTRIELPKGGEVVVEYPLDGAQVVEIRQHYIEHNGSRYPCKLKQYCVSIGAMDRERWALVQEAYKILSERTDYTVDRALPPDELAEHKRQQVVSELTGLVATKYKHLSLTAEDWKVLPSIAARLLVGWYPWDAYLRDDNTSDIKCKLGEPIVLTHRWREVGRCYTDVIPSLRDFKRLARCIRRSVRGAEGQFDPKTGILQAVVNSPELGKFRVVMFKHPAVPKGELVVEIRKHRGIRFAATEMMKPYKLGDSVVSGTITPEALAYLVLHGSKDDSNEVGIGSPGSGKTTLMNLVNRHMPPDFMRVVIGDIIETSPEDLTGIVVTLQAREQEGGEKIGSSIREMLAQTLRIRQAKTHIEEVMPHPSREHTKAVFDYLSANQVGSQTMHARDFEGLLERLRVEEVPSEWQLLLDTVIECKLLDWYRVTGIVQFGTKLDESGRPTYTKLFEFDPKERVLKQVSDLWTPRMAEICKYHNYGREEFEKEYQAIRDTFYCFLATDRSLEEIRRIECVKEVAGSPSLLDVAPPNEVLDFERELFKKFWTAVHAYRSQGKEPDWDHLLEGNYKEVQRFAAPHKA